MYGNIRCVTYAELVESGLISIHMYKKYAREKRFRIVRRGGNGRKALIDFESLPDKVRSAYLKMFPKVEMEKEGKISRLSLKPDFSAVVYFYDRYRLPNGARLADHLISEYVLNAEVMNRMIRFEKELIQSYAKIGCNGTKQLWESVYKYCEDLRKVYSHTLPRCERRLHDKFNAYKKEGYIVLISAKNGNKNAKK